MTATGRALAAVVALLALAGCMSVPTTGDVRGGDPALLQGLEAQQPEVRINPAPPQPGASPAEIVRGFYDAMVDASDNHRVARQYLLHPQRPWPLSDEPVVVYYGPLEVPLADESGSTFRVAAPMAATVQPDHTFRAAEPGEAFTDTIRVARNADGEFRVVEPPAGPRVALADFGWVYQQVTVYAKTPDCDERPDACTLVPERLFFPGVRRELPDLIGRAYARAGSTWVGPAAEPVLPSGVSFRAAQLFEAQGLLRLAFTQPGLGPSPADRRVLDRAVLATFTPELFPEVRQIHVAVNADWNILERPEPAEPSAPTLGLSAVWVRTGTVVRPFEGVSAGGPFPTYDVSGLSLLALSPNTEAIAGVGRDEDGRQVLVLRTLDGREWRYDVGADTLARPAWMPDGSGLVVGGSAEGMAAGWFVEVGWLPRPDGTFVPRPREPRRVAIDARWRSTGTVLEMRPSPDGTRVSVVVRPAGDDDGTPAPSELYVGRFQPFGGDRKVRDLRRVAPVLHDLRAADQEEQPAWQVSSARWIAGDRLLAIGNSGGSGWSLWTLSYDGSEATQEPAGPLPVRPDTRLAAMPGATVFAVGDDEQLWRRDGSVFVAAPTNPADEFRIVDAFYPG